MRCFKIMLLGLLVLQAAALPVGAHAAEGLKFSYHAGLYAQHGLLWYQDKLYALAVGTGFDKKTKFDVYRETYKYYPEGTSRITRCALTDQQQFMLVHPLLDPNDKTSHIYYLAVTKENALIAVRDKKEAATWRVTQHRDPDIPVEKDSFEGFLVTLRSNTDDPQKRHVALSPEKTVIKAATGQDIVLHQLILGPQADAAQFEFVTGYSGK